MRLGIGVLLCVLAPLRPMASSLGHNEQLATPESLSSLTRKQLVRAEDLFCGAIGDLPNLIEELFSLNESDFPEYLKKFKLALNEKISKESDFLKELDLKISRLKKSIEKVDLPKLAANLNADYHWHGTSLIYFKEKEANQASSSQTDFLRRFGSKAEKTPMQKVWSSQPGIPRLFYEYDLNLEAVAIARNEFNAASVELKDLENLRWNLQTKLRKMNSLKTEIEGDARFDGKYLYLKGMTLFFDKETKKVLLVEDRASDNFLSSQQTTGIEICSKERIQEKEEDFPYISLTREECEKLFDKSDLAFDLEQRVLEPAAKRSAMNVSKAEILKVLSDTRDRALKSVSNEKDAELVKPSIILEYERAERTLRSTKLLSVPLINVLLGQGNMTAKMRFALKEGVRGIEVYPVLQKIDLNATPRSAGSDHYVGMGKFLSSQPMAIIDPKLFDLKKLREHISNRTADSQTVGLPNGYVHVSFINEYLHQAKEDLCGQLL